MPRTPSIRPYVDADLDPLVDLWVEAWSATMPTIDFLARRGWIRELLQSQEASGALTICADDADGRVVGFALLEPRRNWLEQLAARPSHFGAGIGQALLNAAQKICPEKLSLRVNQDNVRAVRFYTRAGFAIVAAGTNPGGTLKTWDMTWRATS